VIAARQWIVEDHDNAVAHESLERSAEAADLLPEAGMIFAQNGQDLFGLGGFREAGEAAQVTEHHGHLAAMAFE
jgi:hypothetical protein